MFDMFESLLPLATDPAQGTSTERFAELYARATSNTRAEGKRQESADTLVEDDSARKGVDENCGSCDVCDRRYGPPEVHEQGSIDEPDNFQLITNEEIEIIENAFRNDISVPFAELVKRVSASNDARLKGRRARDTIEFLAVSGVLKMRFEHIYSRNATRFSTKLEKVPFVNVILARDADPSLCRALRRSMRSTVHCPSHTLLLGRSCFLSDHAKWPSQNPVTIRA